MLRKFLWKISHIREKIDWTVFGRNLTKKWKKYIGGLKKNKIQKKNNNKNFFLAISNSEFSGRIIHFSNISSIFAPFRSIFHIQVKRVSKKLRSKSFAPLPTERSDPSPRYHVIFLYFFFFCFETRFRSSSLNQTELYAV